MSSQDGLTFKDLKIPTWMITKYDGEKLEFLVKTASTYTPPLPVVLRIGPKNSGEESNKSYLQVTALPKKIYDETGTLQSTFRGLHSHLRQATTCRKTNFVTPDSIIFSLGTAGVDYSNGVFDIAFETKSSEGTKILEDSEKVDMEINLLMNRQY